MNSETKSEVYEEWALAIFLVACFLLSFFKDVFPLLEKGLEAALFAAVFFILKQVRDLRVEVRGGRNRESFFESAQDFYTTAAESVRRGKREIRATYFRDAPPGEAVGDACERYFEDIVEFARTRRRTVRRIISVNNKEMVEWCRAQADLDNSIPSYYVRVLDTGAGAVEPMSMVIIDDETIYLAFSGHTHEQLGGVRPRGEKLAQFLRQRFDSHWAVSIPAREFLASERCVALLQESASAH